MRTGKFKGLQNYSSFPAKFAKNTNSPSIKDLFIRLFLVNSKMDFMNLRNNFSLFHISMWFSTSPGLQGHHLLHSGARLPRAVRGQAREQARHPRVRDLHGALRQRQGAREQHPRGVRQGVRILMEAGIIRMIVVEADESKRPQIGKRSD